jgi:multiple sugar transport system substrate-binding protein
LIEVSHRPTRRELYQDEELLREVQIAELGQEAIRNMRPRPVSPFYSDMSLRMIIRFVRLLRDDVQPSEVTSPLQEELGEILEQGRL